MFAKNRLGRRGEIGVRERARGDGNEALLRSRFPVNRVAAVRAEMEGEFEAVFGNTCVTRCFPAATYLLLAVKRG